MGGAHLHEGVLARRAALLLPLFIAALCPLAAAQADVDAAFAAFWNASSPVQAAAAIDDILRSGVEFDEAYARLKRGRTYRADVPRGVVRLHHSIPQGESWYSVQVPDTYDPARSYQVRMQLHGGVLGRAQSEIRGDGSIGALAGAEQIYVMPTAWEAAPWWSSAQLANLRIVLDTLKRTYNVDENRVTLAGVSDGATGTWYVAMRDSTPYANFASLNGALIVLQSPGINLDGSLFPQNLTNKPFFIINGGRDRLYPIALVQPFIEHMMKKGVEVVYRPRPEGEHNTAWFPEERDGFETFVHDRPRNPLPDRISWESDLGGEETNRSHWLVIDRLSDQPDFREPLPDVNIYEMEPEPGMPADLTLPPLPLFPSWQRSGRVDLVREGNAIRAATRGIGAFTLLLSPDAFDFSQPILVIVDGREVFDGRVSPSLPTLLKWAARDNDRTMLFGAELTITLP